jgi:hypothetical protein
MPVQVLVFNSSVNNNVKISSIALVILKVFTVEAFLGAISYVHSTFDSTLLPPDDAPSRISALADNGA